MRIERPIFVIGSGRSGTTLVQDLLSGHPDVAWFSNYTNRWPKVPQLAALSQLHAIEALHRRLQRGLPAPSEGHAVWDACKPVPNSPGDPPLEARDVREGDRARITKIVALHMRYHGRPRFMNKNTRNTRRIGFLHEIFPDALFLHVLRDPRAVSASLLRVGFWPDLKLWSQRGMTPREWEAQGRDTALLAAHLWTANVQRALNDKAVLPHNQYMEIHYESLVAHPREVMSNVLSFYGLEWSTRFDRFFQTFTFKDMNYKYHHQLTEDQIATIETETAPLARRLGYELRA